jgi:YebC/PmpR family DNA-binding regulatory protein
LAGHSKWANIQHRKKAQDAKRGKIFTRLIREIMVAAKAGGSDSNSNASLRAAVEKAKSQSVPKDAIERAVKRGAGELEGSDYEEIRYEGYGLAGIAIIVDCLTDNRNRTVAEVRHAFSKAGGNLGQDGSVAFMFSSIGVLTYAPGSNEDAIMEAALEAGADDVVIEEDGLIEVLTAPGDYVRVKESMIEAGLEPEESELTMRTANNIELNSEDGEKVMRLIDALEELDDVQEVFSNADFPEEIMQ